jgi:hypothetical protein
MEREWVAESIRQGMDFGTQSTFAAAHRLGISPPLGPGAVLMGAHNSRVNHGIFVIGVVRQGLKYP